jgi:hypothetical protein
VLEQNRIDGTIDNPIFGDNFRIDRIELEVTTYLTIMAQLKLFFHMLIHCSAGTHSLNTVERVAKRLDLVMIQNMKTRQIPTKIQINFSVFSDLSTLS